MDTYPKERMVSTTVYLRGDQVRELRKLSAKTRIPQSVLIRRGVDYAIKETRLDWSLRERR